MMTNANDLPNGAQLFADVCIVGAGAAGITLALSLADKGVNVLLLESGFIQEHQATQALYQGEVTNTLLHSPPDKYRQRRFGGSTTIWGGRCMPFDPIDFEQRDYVPASGWPITYSDLAAYYPQANLWVEAGEYAYDADQIFNAQTQAMLTGFSSPILLTNNLERFSCPTNFADRYQNRLRLAPNIQLLLGANCFNIELADGGMAVKNLALATLTGKRFSVSAQSYVLATGGIETVRLLLASRDVCQLGIGNDYDNVGRYYMCHIAGNIGELAIAGSVDRVRHGYEISADGIYCRRRLALSAAAQRQFGVANMIARLHFPVISDPAHGIGVLSCLFLAKHLISYEYAYRLHDNVKLGVTDYLQHVLNVISDPLDTATFAWRWLTQRTLADRKFPSVILRNRSNHFSLDIHSEQLPNPSSRITLADSYDELSMPRVRIDWRYLPEDIDSVRRTLQVFAAELSNSGVASYRFDEAKLEDDLTRFGAYGGHHIGTTRMGDNPKTSVVDRNGKLHTQRNLYIAGSSVFPTSGQANPTLTVIALTLRLAEHLATVLTKN